MKTRRLPYTSTPQNKTFRAVCVCGEGGGGREGSDRWNFTRTHTNKLFVTAVHNGFDCTIIREYHTRSRVTNGGSLPPPFLTRFLGAVTGCDVYM